MADPSAAGPSMAESLDALIASFFASHNPVTYLLLGIITITLVYPLFTSSDPDIHPFLLARQSSAAPIRNSGESPVYRALDVPHGYPLKASLGVKDPGAPKWTSGRQGDVRDVLARAVRGPLKEDGSGYDATKVGKVITLLGKDKSTSTEMGELMRIVNAIGGFAKGRVQGDGKVAVCLDNSVELLAAVFAAAFYDFSVTLIPSGLPQELLNHLLKQIDIHVLVVAAGAHDLDSALPNCKSLKQVILVAKPDNKHMAWDDTPMPKGVEVATWHDILDQSSATKEVPTIEKDSPKPKPLGTFFLNSEGEMELAEFTSENIVSGIAGLLATLPRTQPLSPTDTLLPTSSLTTSYTLCWALGALYTNGSLALTSVAGPGVDLFASLASFKPTILVTAPGTLNKYLLNYSHTGLGPGRIAKFWQRRSLSQGIMPSRRPIPDLNGQDAVMLIVELQSLANVRAVFVGQDADAKNKNDRMSSKAIDELRVDLGLKIGYALTSGRVAGAVAQTHLNDYRDKKASVCVGPPLGSVEVHMVGEEDGMGTPTPSGKLVVKGPSVVGGKVELDTAARIDGDNTLVLL